MGEQNSSPIQKQCIACRESIVADALICPKCRSPQKPQRWANTLSILKWIGGLTAIISLVIGVKQVSGIVKEWKERDKAVNQIVVASKMLVEMRDYQAAWEISKKATIVAPSSKKAFDQQVDVGLAWIRDIHRQKGKKTYSEIIDPLILTLSQGAGDANPNRAATVLAHIGWANFWRLRDEKAKYEIETYFSHAIKHNPEDTYANLFKGYWLLNIHYKGKRKKDGKSRLSDAMAHFSKAVKTNKNTHFVNEWMISALTGSNVPGADVEAIKIANEWRKQNIVSFEQYKSTPYWLLEEFEYLYRQQLSKGTFLPRLMSELSVQEIKDTYLWLLNQNERKDWDIPKIFYLGLMSEAGGDLKSAYDNYVEVFTDEEFLRNYGSYARAALCRLLVKILDNEGTTTEVQIPNTVEKTIVFDDQYRFETDRNLFITKLSGGASNDDGLMIGDNLLMIDKEPIVSFPKIDQIRQDVLSGKRAYADLLILRESKLIYYRVLKEKE